jgi:hypothetical protein
MAARVYYFQIRQGPSVPVVRKIDGIVAAFANLDDIATAAARLASLNVAAAAAGLRIPSDYFVEINPVGATPANNLSVAFSAIFLGDSKILTGTGS